MKISSTTNSCVTCPKPNPQADLRLFCFPYAGGSSLIFRTWASSLPKNIEVYPIELPGRLTQMKSPPFTRMETLVSAIAPILLPYLDKPFAFFGHSMGRLQCPITAFGGLEDQEVNIQELEGWRSLSTNSFQLEMFSGDHFFIHSVQSLLLENNDGDGFS
jgi:surfactin synthase thioesterase subunit